MCTLVILHITYACLSYYYTRNVIRCLCMFHRYLLRQSS